MKRRQVDLAERAGVSRDVVSNIERGLGGRVSAATLARAAYALDARLDISLRWRGEGLDRLPDAAHATLVERMVGILVGHGWELAVEASFEFDGVHGSIDILAFHRMTSTLLVVEVKSVVPDSQATLHALDRKARMATRVAAERGWPVATAHARILIVGEGTTSRRRIRALAATYRVALPARGVAVRRWLREPSGPLAGLMFLPFASQERSRRTPTGVSRVRRAAVGVTRRDSSPAVAL